MSSASLNLVKQLKFSLSKELDRSEPDVERCSDILSQLESVHMNLDILSQTLVGTVVAKFKSHADSAVSNKAKSLIKNWKEVAKGVSSTPKSSDIESSSQDKKMNQRDVQDFSLPPHRKLIAQKLLESFTATTNAKEDAETHHIEASSIVTQVEEAIHTQSRNDKAAYTDKARSLLFNIKKNTNLREEILGGRISAHDLVLMRPEQLATVEKTKMREQLVQELHESRRLDWEQANEGKINEMCGIKGDLLKASLFKCGRCKSEKTTSTQKQTRSADEPMTVFVLCMNCGNRWKC